MSLTPEPEFDSRALDLSLVLLRAVTVARGSRDPAAPAFTFTYHYVEWFEPLSFVMTGSGAPLHLKDHLTSGEQRGACFSSIPEPVPSSAHALSSLCGRHSPGIDTSFSLHFPKEILILCVQQCCYRGGVVAEVDAV